MRDPTGGPPRSAGRRWWSPAVAAVLWIVFDPRWRNLAFYGYKSLMRALTGLFIPENIKANYASAF